MSQIRGIHEAINVGKLMKMNAEQAFHATFRTCQEVIQHGIARKNRFLPLEIVTPQQFEEIFQRDYAEDAQRHKRKNNSEEDLVTMFNAPKRKRNKTDKDDNDKEDSMGDDPLEDSQLNKVVDATEDDDDGFLRL